MAKKKETVPEYSQVTQHGCTYYRTRIQDANGKRIALYGETREELHQKVIEARKIIAEEIYHKENPTVREYCEKWLTMQSAVVRPTTLYGYRGVMQRYIIDKIGNMYLDEVTADDLKLLMVPVSKMSAATYSTVNMLIKCVFYSAERNSLIATNPSAQISAKGGTPRKEKNALTDEQAHILLDTVKDLPPYLFVMLGLYAGLRREEILGLKWDCVFLNEKTPYISVRRAWHSNNNRPIIDTNLKTKAAKRDIPIPGCLVKCLSAAKEKALSEFVISDASGNPLAETQFRRLWNYITVRTTKERKNFRYINGVKVVTPITPTLGGHPFNNPELTYTMDFYITPHILRHTYITNLIYAGVDPKTVQYLAGHENSKTTMDIYCKVKYNKPKDLLPIVNRAFSAPTNACI